MPGRLIFGGHGGAVTWLTVKAHGQGRHYFTSIMCMCVYIYAERYFDVQFVHVRTYVHILIHTHTHAQIRCYKSLVDVSIVNLKDDSRSKLPAVFDTKKLQEHFERCYWPVPSQSAMRPIKQSDAMYLESQTDVTVYGIPRHWLRADFSTVLLFFACFQEDRADIAWNNPKTLGCKGIHFMDCPSSSNMW